MIKLRRKSNIDKTNFVFNFYKSKSSSLVKIRNNNGSN